MVSRRAGAWGSLGFLIALLGLGSAAVAQAEPPPEKNWSFAVTPYIWLPAMTGEATLEGRSVDIDTSISDLFTESDFVFALQAQFEVWYKRRWGAAFNGQWTILKQDDNLFGPTDGPPFGPGVFPIEFDLSMNLGFFEFLLFYDPGEWAPEAPLNPSFFIQPLVGARVTVMRLKLEASGSDPSQTKTWADPILGARMGVHFGPERRWSWRLRGDFGGFGAGSDFTWNVMGMFAYDFRARVPVSVGLGARALYQNFDDGSGNKRFEWDVTQYGPMFVVQFPF